MANIRLLAPHEYATRDAGRIRNRLDGDDCPVTMDLTEDAMRDLEDTLERATACYRQGDLAGLAMQVRAAAELAGGLGLARAFRVGHTVAALAARNDPAALGATLARMVRLCDQAFDAAGARRDGIG